MFHRGAPTPENPDGRGVRKHSEQRPTKPEHASGSKTLASQASKAAEHRRRTAIRAGNAADES